MSKKDEVQYKKPVRVWYFQFAGETFSTCAVSEKQARVNIDYKIGIPRNLLKLKKWRPICNSCRECEPRDNKHNDRILRNFKEELFYEGAIQHEKKIDPKFGLS